MNKASGQVIHFSAFLYPVFTESKQLLAGVRSEGWGVIDER
jgi:hypothetical protein